MLIIKKADLVNELLLQFVNELLHCYTETANCSLFKEASSLNGYPWTGVVQ